MPLTLLATRAIVRSSAVFAMWFGLSEFPVTTAAEPVRLTTDGKSKTDPVFVKGGEEVIYTVQESPTQMALMRLRLSDRTTERLHPDATQNEFEPAFSPDGSTYAFIQSRGNLNLKLVIRDTKAAKDSQFDPGGGFASLRRPTFSPNGSRIAFSLPAASGQQIVTIDRQGADQKTLTSGGLNNWPCYSPDGNRLVFSSSRDGDFDLYTMKSNGENVQRLLARPGLDARPVWSPDGKRIAFTGNRNGSYDIMLVHADGSGLAPLIAHPDRDDYPAWHPDGKQLIFVGERNGRSDLYLADVPKS